MSEAERPSRESPEEFLSRWSRRKQQARVQEQAPVPQAKPPTPATAAEPPPLPAVDDLTMASDYRGFLHPKVDEGLRRAALKKLFSDPHFNVMDGLDTYIDDYSIPDPLPPGMLEQMKQAQSILTHSRERREAEAARVAAAEAEAGADAAAGAENPGRPAPDAPAGTGEVAGPVPDLPHDGTQTA